MIYTTLTKKAMKLMQERHAGQYDKAGLLYAFHPWHVAEMMDDEISTCTALLHDIIEDTKTTIDELKSLEFPDEVLEALSLLTHDKNDDYNTYIEKIATNKVAMKVKLADLKHNSILERLDNVTQKDLDRKEKYKKSIDYLQMHM